MDKIQKLRDQLLAITKLGSTLELLGWDEEVNLPPRGHHFRGEVSAVLAAEVHNRFTADDFYNLVNELAATDVFNGLTADEQVIVRETKHDVEQARKIPTEFVEQMTRLTTKAFAAWVEARQKSDYKIFEPILAEIVAMKVKEAELLGYQDSAYDALLDEFEPGMTVKQIDAVFGPLSENLASLIGQVKPNPKNLPAKKYPLSKQQELNRAIVAALGYDLSAGRIDESPHPFSVGIHPTDVRITTRYDESDFWVSLGAAIHESGHAMYEQGLPASEYGTPLAEAVSLGIHESQSRTWENFVGRSRQFCNYLHPRLITTFGDLSYSAEDLYKWLNRVEPSPIRVEADEVTYNLHIIIRYELEKDLMAGQLKVGDIPGAWNQKVKQYLGIDIKNDAEGCLQDVHWSHGTLGYFPTYTLGNLYAAQFFDKLKKDQPQLEESFDKGDFTALLNWLRQNIHSQGRRYKPAELVEKVTGETLNPAFLLEHLEQKVKLQS